MRSLLYRWRLRRWNRAWKRRAARFDPHDVPEDPS